MTLEVDDVDSVSFAEDVRCHLRVPVSRLVTEVNSGLQHAAHRDDGHQGFLENGLCLHAPHAPTPLEAPGRTCRYVCGFVVLPCPRRARIYTISSTLRSPVPPMAISIKTPDEIEKMRVAGRLAAEVLDMIEPYVTAGGDDRRARLHLSPVHRGGTEGDSRLHSTTGAFRSRSAPLSTTWSATGSRESAGSGTATSSTSTSRSSRKASTGTRAGCSSSASRR